MAEPKNIKEIVYQVAVQVVKVVMMALRDTDRAPANHYSES